VILNLLPISLPNDQPTGRRIGIAGILVWIVLTVIGSIIVIVAPFGLAIIDAWEGLAVLIWGAAGAITGAVAGCVVGAGQRPFLLQSRAWAKHWVRACTLGWALGGAAFWVALRLFTMAEFAPSPIADFLPFAILGSVFGLGIGFGQWMVVRSYMDRIWWWAFISSLTWIVPFSAFGVAESFLISRSANESTFSVFMILLGLAVGLTGLISGLTVNLLLAQPEKT